MFDHIVTTISNNPAITAAIGAGIAAAGSEIIGASPLKSSGWISLLINIVKTIVKASSKDGV